MATSLYKAQIPFRVKGQTTCIHHKGGQLDLYCEECQQLACINCLSTVHKSHPLCKLNEITPQKKEDIQNFINKTEKADLVQIDRYITDTDEQLKDNASNFENLARRLNAQTNKLKDDLDLLTAQTLSLYQQMEQDNTKLLQTYKQDLEMYSAQLKQQVQECKIALQRGSDLQIYDKGCEIRSPVTVPVKPTLGTASFRPNQNHQSHLEQALGKVDISSQGHDQTLQVHDRSIGSSARQRLHSTQPQSNLKVKTASTQQRSAGRKALTGPVFTVLPETKVLENWRSPSLMTSVCPTTDGQVWTSGYGRDTLTLLDRKGKVIHDVKINIESRHISQSPTTNKLWICDWTNSIKELVSGQLVHRFSTRETPECICITASNNVIVGMYNNISKYTTEGKLVLTTLANWHKKPIVYKPHRIAECPVTHNVAVSEYDDGEQEPRVVVMDTNFEELFVYNGKVPHAYRPTSKSRIQEFNPRGVVYDSVGNLVIGDRDNGRILLISGRGEFLKIIHTDDDWIMTVGIDREDVLWAVFGGNHVKLLQYRRV